jgi:hypothetical protein
MSLLVTTALLAVVLWLTLPLVTGYLILGLLTMSGFNGTDTQVDVRANPPLTILGGKADSVRLISNDVSVGELHAIRIDLQLDDVAVVSRHVGAVRGSFTGVQIRAASVPGQTTTPVTADIEQVTLEGPSNATAATIVMSGSEVAALAESQLKASAGITATVTFKAPDVVTIKSGKKSQKGHLKVKDGAFLLVPDSGSLPTVVLIQPGKDEPFVISGATVGAGASGGQVVTLTGTIDIQSLLD